MLGISAPRCGPGLAVGDSIAVNGVCLTATLVAEGPGGDGFTVETVPELSLIHIYRRAAT